MKEDARCESEGMGMSNSALSM
ncbi:hypothetical protein RHCRD62_10585 [Rhodococcus sp. RD6.2]|nr:hypothetical protein RHCRD62_10585 [Rhodococcus sp. RD6.2]